MDDLQLKYWKIDKATLGKMQVLKQFVDFVAAQKETSSEQKNNAANVKYCIENLDKPEAWDEDWFVCIDMFDGILQSGKFGHKYKENRGLYWKKWWVWFEQGEFGVESGEHYVEPNGEMDEKWNFSCTIQLHKKWDGILMFGDTNFNAFVEDALNFRKYVTKDLNEIETEIEVSG